MFGLARSLVVLSLVALLSSACGPTWMRAKRLDSVDAYREFLAQKPDSRHADEAARSLEAAEWRVASAAGTAYAYRAYLARYASGEYAAAAELRLEDIAWQDAARIGTQGAYAAFLRANARSPRCGEAKRRIEELAWAEAGATNTEAGYLQFVREHPSSPHEAEAMAAASDRAASEALAANQVNGIRDVLERYPASPRRPELQGRLDALLWQDIERKPEIAGLELYVALCPSGERIDQVREMLEARRFEEAVSHNTREGYQSYLRAYPDGPHAREAERGLAALIEAEVEAARASLREELREEPDDALYLYRDYVDDHPDDGVIRARFRKLLIKESGLQGSPAGVNLWLVHLMDQYFSDDPVLREFALRASKLQVIEVFHDCTGLSLPAQNMLLQASGRFVEWRLGSSYLLYEHASLFDGVSGRSISYEHDTLPAEFLARYNIHPIGLLVATADPRRSFGSRTTAHTDVEFHFQFTPTARYTSNYDTRQSFEVTLQNGAFGFAGDNAETVDRAVTKLPRLRVRSL